MTPREFIQRIVAVSSTGSVNDEAISNLSINTGASSLSEDTSKIYSRLWDSFPAYFSGFRLIADDQRLFELSGRELSVNDEGQRRSLTAIWILPSMLIFYRRGFDRYYQTKYATPLACFMNLPQNSPMRVPPLLSKLAFRRGELPLNFSEMS